jgi:hypothetical protein
LNDIGCIGQSPQENCSTTGPNRLNEIGRIGQSPQDKILRTTGDIGRIGQSPQKRILSTTAESAFDHKTRQLDVQSDESLMLPL